MPTISCSFHLFQNKPCYGLKSEFGFEQQLFDAVLKGFFNSLFVSLNQFGHNVLHLVPNKREREREREKKKKSIQVR